MRWNSKTVKGSEYFLNNWEATTMKHLHEYKARFLCAIKSNVCVCKEDLSLVKVELLEDVGVVNISSQPVWLLITD